MTSVARIFALAGVLLLGIGAFLPVTTVSGDICEVGAKAFINTECLQDGAKEGFLASNVGVLLVIVALIGLLPALQRRPAALWVLGLMTAGLVAVLWLYVDALLELGAIQDTEWGWGALVSSAVLILLGALVATFAGGRRSVS